MKTHEVDQVIEILDCLKTAERRVGDFYTACSTRWRDAKVYWVAMARAEYGHAKLIEAMKEIVRRFPGAIHPAPEYTPENVTRFIARVDELKGNAAQGIISLEDAMIIALDLEEFLSEKCLSQAISTDREDFKQLREKIISEENNHRMLFKIALDEMAADNSEADH